MKLTQFVICFCCLLLSVGFALSAVQAKYYNDDPQGAVVFSVACIVFSLIGKLAAWSSMPTQKEKIDRLYGRDKNDKK